jgi:hypothetical protein
MGYRKDVIALIRNYRAVSKAMIRDRLEGKRERWSNATRLDFLCAARNLLETNGRGILARMVEKVFRE